MQYVTSKQLPPCSCPERRCVRNDPPPCSAKVNCLLVACGANQERVYVNETDCCGTCSNKAVCATFAPCADLTCPKELQRPADFVNSQCCPYCAESAVDCLCPAKKCPVGFVQELGRVPGPTDDGKCGECPIVNCVNRPPPPCSKTALCPAFVCGPDQQRVYKSEDDCCGTCVSRTDPPTTNCAAVLCEAITKCAPNETLVPADMSSGRCCAQCMPAKKPPNCAAVLCEAVTKCAPNETLVPADASSGRCCARCVPAKLPPNCAAVLCEAITKCGPNAVLQPANLAEGQCCPRCVPVGNICDRTPGVPCTPPPCDDPVPADPQNGRCCPRCKTTLNCAAVRCAEAKCAPDERLVRADNVTRCCDQCEATLPINCAAVSCLAVECSPDETKIPADLKAGRCCKRCVPKKCADEPCPGCDSRSLWVPPQNGECCGRCLPKKCADEPCPRAPCKPPSKWVPPQAEKGECCGHCSTVGKCDLVACTLALCASDEITIPADPASGQCCKACLKKGYTIVRAFQLTLKGKIDGDLKSWVDKLIARAQSVHPAIRPDEIKEVKLTTNELGQTVVDIEVTGNSADLIKQVLVDSPNDANAIALRQELGIASASSTVMQTTESASGGISVVGIVLIVIGALLVVCLVCVAAVVLVVRSQQPAQPSAPPQAERSSHRSKGKGKGRGSHRRGSRRGSYAMTSPTYDKVPY